MKYTRDDFIARIAVATPLQLVIINYELLIYSIDDAIENSSDEEKFVFHMQKAREYLIQLQTSLDMSYEISESLMSIYLYLNKIFINATNTGKPDNLSEAKKILESLLSSWKDISKDENSNILSNSPTHTNIGYNRGGIIDDYDINDSNRGYQI